MNTDILLEIQEHDTLYRLLQKRAEATPNKIAYQQFDEDRQIWCSYTWQQVLAQSRCYQSAFRQEGLQAGDRVAVMMRNCVQWVVFDQAAAALGLVTVPIFSNDTADNCAYILSDSSAKLLLIGNQQQLNKIKEVVHQAPDLNRVISLQTTVKTTDIIQSEQQWLSSATENVAHVSVLADDLATIIYTSGTTGNPKGVMLTHRNIVQNAAALRFFPINEDDLFVSFLPLSHVFERTVGYYFIMIKGAEVAFARSLITLMADIRQIRPSALLAVPKFYDQIVQKIQTSIHSRLAKRLIEWLMFAAYQYYQGPKAIRYLFAPFKWGLDLLIAKKVRLALGGRMRLGVCGGAAISPGTIRMLGACGIPIYQGYGLTEAAPVIAVNAPHDDALGSVGKPIPGAEVRIGRQHEILTRSQYLMKGYWQIDNSRSGAIDGDGFLHTGDMGYLDADHRLYITGRIKDIIVMANGEKVSPADMEVAITSDPLIQQAMIYGEGRDFLIALIVPQEEALRQQMKVLGIESVADPAVQLFLKKRIKKSLRAFPGYAKVRRLIVMSEPWSIENGMLTSTVKIKRHKIISSYQQAIDHAYQ